MQFCYANDPMACQIFTTWGVFGCSIFSPFSFPFSTVKRNFPIIIAGALTHMECGKLSHTYKTLLAEHVMASLFFPLCSDTCEANKKSEAQTKGAKKKRKKMSRNHNRA